VPGAVRNYDTGQSLRNDVVDARVWLGIHFRSADTGGVDMGQRVADWALDHYFGAKSSRPTRRTRQRPTLIADERYQNTALPNRQGRVP